MFILLDQYHCHWWFGNTITQGINSHDIELVFQEYYSFGTVKWGNFGRWGNFGQFKTFILSNIFCHLKNNLVMNMEVKSYLQSVICFKRSLIRLDPMIS